MKNLYTHIHFALLCAIATVACMGGLSCKKLTTAEAPVTSVNAGNVYNNDGTAASVLTGIYASMASFNQGFNQSITTIYLYQALSADELTLYNTNDLVLEPYYTNSLTSTTPTVWDDLYYFVFIANAAIDGLNSSSGLTPAVKQQLLGEAEFVRAFCYFYLVNSYGPVPLVVTSNYKTTAGLGRAAATQVYEQIVADLEDAQINLSAFFLKSDAKTPDNSGVPERVRPSRMAATALLARVYLYVGNFPGADSAASAVIGNSDFSLDSLNSVFLKNSTETIWALQPVGVGVNSNTGDGDIFNLPSTGPNTFPNEVYLSNNLLASFEPADGRRTNWVDSVVGGGVTYYYPYKYKIGAVNKTTQEYIMVLRLGEQYLIRAEARAHEGNLTGAAGDLNTIRSRAGLPNTAAASQADLLSAVLHERQVELFTEWGHRWFDLIRTNNVGTVMSVVAPQKGGTWDSHDELYPIPQSEITLDSKLVQNTGY